MDSKKYNNLIFFPSTIFVFICIRLRATEFQISSQSYLSLIISIIAPFIIFYVVEGIRYINPKSSGDRVDLKKLLSAIMLLVVGIFSLFQVYFTLNPSITIY